MATAPSTSTTESCTSKEETYSRPPPNSPAWLHIPCTSVPRAQAFYSSIFKWDFCPPAPGYAADKFLSFSIPGTPMMGALVKSSDRVTEVEGKDKEEENKSGKNKQVRGIVLSLMVEDVAATLEKVKSEGGKVVDEMRVEGNHTELGRFEDTEGNVVGVLKWL